MGGHFIHQCIYGYSHGQCRCPGPKTLRRVPCDNLEHKIAVRTPSEWCQIFAVKILDPDGWRHRDDGVTWETPITGKDFFDRLCEPTVGNVRSVLDLHRLF